MIAKTRAILYKNQGLIRTASASGISRISTSLWRVSGVAILLRVMGADDYGIWIILTSISGWIGMIEFGIGATAANEISRLMASGNVQESARVYSFSKLRLRNSLLWGAGLTAIIVSIFAIPDVHRSLGGSFAQISPIQLGLMFVAILLAIPRSLCTALYRGSSRFEASILLQNLFLWIELGSVALAYIVGRSLTMCCAGLCLSKLLTLAVYYENAKKGTEGIRTPTCVLPQFSGALKKSSIAFTAFPIGYALINDGAILVIGQVIGPSSVVIFSAIRTFVRFPTQMTEFLKQSVYHEISVEREMLMSSKSKKIFALGLSLSFVTSLVFVIFTNLLGGRVVGIWLGRDIEYSPLLFLLLSLAILPNSAWNFSAVLLEARNLHGGLAAIFVLASVLYLVVGAVVGGMFGLISIAALSLTVEVVLCFVVFAEIYRYYNGNPLTVIISD